jgi:HK97 family phage portal protein
MGLFDRLFGSKEQRGASMTLENPSVSVGDILADGLLGSAIAVNEATILSIPAVKRAVSVISSTISGLPIQIKQKSDEGYLKPQPDHPLRYLLNYEPNAVNDKVVFFETLITNSLIHGNGFAIINRNKDYSVESLQLLHPDLVTVKVLKNGNVRYEVSNLAAKRRQYRPDEILHIQGASTNGFIGFSNLELHKDTFLLALNVINFGKAYYENGGFLSGVVKHPASLSDAAHKRIKNSLSRYSGSGKAGKQLILDEGMDYQTLTINPAQAGFVEVNQYLISEFSRIFGVPPFMLQDLSKSTMQNVESLTLSFVKHTIIEHLNKLQSELTRKLLTEAEKYAGNCIVFNLDELLKADSRTRGEYIRNLFNVGALSVDEIRLKEGLMPLNTKGSGKHFVQINMGDIEQDLQEKQDTNEKESNDEE